MKPNSVICGDCLDVMKDIPDNYFDLVLTDPPYGLDIHSKNASRGKLAVAKDYGKCEWDKSIPSKEYFDEIIRISKNQVIFGGNYFIEHLTNSPCWIVWDKNNGDNDFADCELAWTSFKSAARLKKYTWNGMLQEDMKNKERRQHPTQKPLPLMRWVLENYSKVGDKVLDPFMGSGTTLRACKDLGREYVGIDISQEYCDIANERLRQGVLL